MASETVALEIGERIGVSQMQVSRLLSRALGYLRPRLLGLDEGTLRSRSFTAKGRQEA